jgi:tetratricopeptide (TPR) repeat protein
MCEESGSSESITRRPPYTTLGWLYLCMGSYQKALSYLLLDRDKIEKLYGSGNAVMSACVYNMGQIFTHLRRFKEADVELQTALRIRTDSLGDKHPETINTLTAIAFLRTQEGRNDEAERYFDRVLKHCEAVDWTAHPRYAMALAGKAEMRLNQNRLGDADQLLDTVTSIREIAYPAQHPFRAHSQWLRARVRLAQSRKEEAAFLAREAIKALSKAEVTKNHTWLKSAQGTLSQIEALPD